MNNAKIISLDQFIISDLADSATPRWSKLRAQLESLVEAGKIICPLSFEHYLESSSRTPEKALANDKLLNILAAGKCLQQEFYITTSLFISLIRNEPFATDIFIRDGVKNVFQDSQKIGNFKSVAGRYKDMVSSGHSLVNEVKTITRKSKIAKPIDSPVFFVMKRLSSQKFNERLAELINTKAITIRGDSTIHGDIANWIDLILEYLLRHFKMTVPESIKLYTEIHQSGFDNIPTLDIISNLRAFQSILHKRITPGDEIDNSRIACGLPVSDVLFTDKKRKSEILELGLDMKYQCNVFCGNKHDITAFEQYLSDL